MMKLVTESELETLRQRIAELERLVGDLRRGRIESDVLVLGTGNASVVSIEPLLAGSSRWDESSATPDTDAPESWAYNTGPRVEMGAVPGGVAVYSGGDYAQSVFLGSADVTITGSMAGTTFAFVDATGASVSVETSPLLLTLRRQIMTAGSTDPFHYALNAAQTGFTVPTAPGTGAFVFLLGRLRRASV